MKWSATNSLHTHVYILNQNAAVTYMFIFKAGVTAKKNGLRFEHTAKKLTQLHIVYLSFSVL